MRQAAVVFVLLTLTSCAIRSAPLFQQDKRLITLQRERDKVKKATDPVSKTKSNIVISEILLDLTRDAARAGDIDSLDKRLDEYAGVIQDAHQTMIKTGKDAHKSPKGFRELEIALRKQVNQLEDIGRALTVDQRDPVDKVRNEAIRLREELLKALFGSQNGPYY